MKASPLLPGSPQRTPSPLPLKDKGDIRFTLRRCYSDERKHLQASFGSAGHPHGCSRACLYFWKGLCRNSQSCKFCHLPHTRRPLRLDKRHRQMLDEMPFGQFIALVRPALEGKAARLGCGPQMVGMFDQLVGLPQNHGQRTGEIRRMLGVFDSMTVRQLLQVFRRFALRKLGQSPNGEVLERAVDWMLRLVASGVPMTASAVRRTMSAPW